jgi:hypothetical protein
MQIDYPQGIYTAGNRDAIFAAAHDFIQNPPDPKAAVIVNHEQTLGGTTIFMVFYFYDGPSPPPGAFGKLTDIKATLDFTTVRTYTELVGWPCKCGIPVVPVLTAIVEL